MRIPVDCPACGGVGYVVAPMDDDGYRCPACGGVGFHLEAIPTARPEAA